MNNPAYIIRNDEWSDNTAEKGAGPSYVVQSNPQYHFDVHDLDSVQRRLQQRHVQMIAIAGTVGTGLYLGSGEALAGAGPLGALIAYALVGSVAYSSLCSVGEMTIWAPISGTFPHFASRWVDPALGFATGWNYFYNKAIAAASEITASVILITFWDKNATDSRMAGYSALLLGLVFLTNLIAVRYFGESEFVFAIIKVILIIGLLLTGLVIDLGGGPNGERTGFKFWKNPGAVAGAGLVHNQGWDRLLAILGVIVQAAFSYQGIEFVVIAASETASPRRNIKKAVNRVFWRILVFYILGILLIGMLVAYNDGDLLSLEFNNTAAASPFVIAINRAGIKVLPHIVNACILTSAFSAGNSLLFTSSRVLYGLALRGQAPRLFTYCTKHGLPIYAVTAAALISLLTFLSVSSGSNKAFDWLTGLTTTGGFISWCVMNITYINFRRGLIQQGVNLKNSPYYHNRLQPYAAYWGAGWTLFFTLINGYRVFWKFDAKGFIIAYINIPIFLVLYFGFKFVKGTSIWRPDEMDFVTGIPTLEETEEPEAEPTNVWERIAKVLF